MPKIQLPEKLLPLIEKQKRFKVIIGGRGCYPAGTEYMSRGGWRKIESYAGEEILVSDIDGNAWYTNDVDYVDIETDQFVRIKNKKVDLTTSIGHRHLLRNEKTKRLDVLTTGEILEKHNNLSRGCKHKLIRAFNHSGGHGIEYTNDYIRLKVAVIADGSFVSGSSSTRCRVNIKKERKIARLKELLAKCGVEYNLTVRDDGFHVFTFKMDNRDKVFKSSWYAATREQLEVIADEIVRWDGSTIERTGRVDAVTFCSVEKETIDFAQFVFHSIGIKADISSFESDKYTNGVLYTICISKHNTESSISIDRNSKTTTEIEYIDSGERMYCFTTPKGFFPIRQNGKVYLSGNSGKSHGVADICLMDAQTTGMKIGMFREFQNSIDDSVYSLLVSEIERLELEGFDVQANKINTANGGAFTFKGLARNPESVKSMAGYKRFVIEEAQTISQKSLELLTPTLREEGSEVWFIANPLASGDPFSQRFIVPFQDALETQGYYEDDLHLVIVMNYIDNPFFPEVLEEERQFDHLNKPRAVYDHVWLGKFLDEVENSIIKPEWFDACVDAHTAKSKWKVTGKKIVSHDPSDNGEDNKGIAYRHGSVFYDVAQMAIGDVSDGCDWATSYALQKQAQEFIWDGDGMGIGLRRQVSDNFKGQKIEQVIFRGSEAADRPEAMYDSLMDNSAPSRKNKDTFKNKRAQYYIDLADRMYRTYRYIEHDEYCDPDEMISFSSDIKDLQALRSELCRIPLKPNGNGKIQIMGKDDMLKAGIKSPNMADSVMMSLAISDKIVNKQTHIPPSIKPVGRGHGFRANQRIGR